MVGEFNKVTSQLDNKLFKNYYGIISKSANIKILYSPSKTKTLFTTLKYLCCTIKIIRIIVNKFIPRIFFNFNHCLVYYNFYAL